MAQNRLDRELEDRSSEERVEAWTPPEKLPSPNMRPGYTSRWIRVANRGETDATNVSSKLREGWTPVLAKDHPEIFLAAVESERFSENIVIGGLLLCEMPEEMAKQRSDYYTKQAVSQMDSVDNGLMRESDPRMPIFNERSSKVSFGNGT